MQPSERRNPLARRQDEEIVLASQGNGQKEIEIKLIRRDGGTQPRDGISQLHVADMRIALQQDKPLPAVEVIYDGESYWLWDGFHRIEAYLAEERTVIAANVRQGTLQDAQWESYSVNTGHGLKRSNADKERQVRNALKHPKAQGMSNAQVAKHVGVDDKTVARYRFEMQAASEIPSLSSRQGADGKSYPALAPRLSKPAPPPEPTTRPLTDEETRHLVWRTIKAEVEIAPSATAVFRWQRYLDWLARHSEPKHFKPHLIDATCSIDGQLLVNATITVGTEIERNLESAKRAAQPTQPKPAPTQPTPATRPLSDEETRHLVWRTIKAENEIAPGATAVFRWQRYLDWLGKHGEPRHYTGGIPHAAGVRIDAITLAFTIADVATEISNNIAAVRIQAESKPSPLPPSPPEPPAITGASLVDRLTNAIGQARFFLTESFAADYEKLTDDYETVDEVDGLLKFMERAIKEAVYKGRDRRAP